jgi:hypothetical protein
MRHATRISRELPAMAGLILPGLPASHPLSFLKDNWPSSIGEFFELISIHIPFWTGDEN